METFSHHWPFVRRINRSPVDSFQYRPLMHMISLLSTWISFSVHSRVLGEMRRLSAWRPSDAYMRQYNILTLVQIMACRLLGAKPLSEPMVPYCWLDPKKHISVKFCLKVESFHSRKYTWKCRLRTGGHFVSASMCYSPIDHFHNSQNAPVTYPTMLHSEQKCGHFCSEWSIVGYGTGAFRELWIRSIDVTLIPLHKPIGVLLLHTLFFSYRHPIYLFSL